MTDETELTYPAVFHFRIICIAENHDRTALLAILRAYHVVEDLTRTSTSNAGTYVTYAVSVEMRDRVELYTFDEQIKAVSGVKMML